MMDITIYQIDPDKDHMLVMFEDFERMASRYGKEEVDASIYGKTFEGEIDAEGLEDVFRIFNVDKPEDGQICNDRHRAGGSAENRRRHDRSLLSL